MIALFPVVRLYDYLELMIVKGRIPEVTMQCIRYLRHQNGAAKISVEVEKPAREGLQALAAEADVVFYSKSWALVSIDSTYRLYHAFFT